MTRPATHVAFLGGINVGGHRVTMAKLREEFESLGFQGVWTFIASGNVAFRPNGANGRPPRDAALAKRIEEHLAARLGYAVPTFVRTAAEVVAIVGRDPFEDGRTRASDVAELVGFLEREATSEEAARVRALSNDVDDLVVRGCELHWRVRGGVSRTSLKPAAMARALSQRMTTRNVVSLAKLAAKLEASPHV